MERPDAEDSLRALQRYFLLNYREQARMRHPLLWDLYPLSKGSRVDVVSVNGGSSAHFFFSRRPADEIVVYLHDVQLVGTRGDETAEKRFIARQFDGPDTLIHLVVQAPFHAAFDRMDEAARRTATDHAALVRPAP